MKKNEKKFYLVSQDVLPASILKTAHAKEMLHSGEASNILEAMDALGMARSTYYKYKDGIFPFYDSSEFHVLNISLMLKNNPGTLSSVLNNIAMKKGNVVTINQNIPIEGTALVTLSVNIEDSDASVDEIIQALEEINGVNKVEIIGKN